MAHRFTRSAATLATLFTTVALSGCDSPGLTSKVKAPNQAVAPPPTSQTTTTSAVTTPSGFSTGVQAPFVFTPGLSVSNLIAEACGIAPQGKANVPSFEFDSAALAEDDRKLLAEVARCLSEGALKGKTVALVGRTDARGEPEYNMTLGGSRADAVHRYLVDLGVGKERLRPTSRGEIDATGKDESGYANDRRVDIELAL